MAVQNLTTSGNKENTQNPSKIHSIDVYIQLDTNDEKKEKM